MKRSKISIQKYKWLVRCVALLLIVACMSSCASTKLPAYQPSLPVKPELEEMPDDELSEEAYRNIVKLIAYSEEQRILLDGWQEYYNNLRTII